MLKAATEGHSDFMGLVIASDANDIDHILPDGTSRQFLAEFGDFDVYIVTADGKRHKYSTYELFPSAGRRVPSSPMKTRVQRRETGSLVVGGVGQRGVVHGRSALMNAVGGAGAMNETDAHEWVVRDVVHWVEDDLELPMLGANFARNAIDGALLLQLSERDLEGKILLLSFCIVSSVFMYSVIVVYLQCYLCTCILLS